MPVVPTETLLEAIRAWVATMYPGCPFRYVHIHIDGVPVPITLAERPGVPPSQAAMMSQPSTASGPTSNPDAETHSSGIAEKEGDAWEPTDYQCRILESLEFRALRSEALVDEIGGDRRRLWKERGIKELVDRGLVKLDREKRLGYFRPDAPPDELAEVED